MPIVIGTLIYLVFGNYIYGDLLDAGKSYIKERFSSGGLGEFLIWILIGLLTVAFYFVLSYTFVLVVSIFASPFNDLISSRVEHLLVEQKPVDITISFNRMMKSLMFTVINELKKIILILILNIIAFAMSFFGILAPISILIFSILMAVGFLDYSWSRKDLKFKDCLKDLKGSIFIYTLSGGMFLLLVTVPIVNLFVLPFGVVYFTVLFTMNSKNKVGEN